MPYKKIEKKCEECGLYFMLRSNHRFCSFKCSNKRKNIGKVRTKEMIKEMRNRVVSKETRIKIGNASRGRTHSQETKIKLSIKLRGDKNPGWKGGIVEFQKMLRRGLSFRQWRDVVLKRDNYICQMCGKKGGVIHVDHIKMFSEIIKENKLHTLDEALLCEELWDINNGQVLCLDCHKIKTTKEKLINKNNG